MEEKKRTITPEKVIELLKKSGTIVTLEEAKIILDFMYNFSKLALDIVANKHEKLL